MSKLKRGVGTQNGDTSGASKGAPFPYGTSAEEGNPTVIPSELMKQFHFTFLIRNPHNSIPSYYRCTIPPLDTVTGFYDFDPAEAGYTEVRRIFDYLIASGQVGPRIAGQTSEQMNGHTLNGNDTGVEICLVDADDLLDNPEGIIKTYCKSVGLEFKPEMLKWDSEDAHNKAKEAFEKWKGFHEDAIDSKDLKPRTHASNCPELGITQLTFPQKKKEKTEEEWDAEWKAKYGEDGAKIIREAVDQNMADYLYLKQFAMRV